MHAKPTVEGCVFCDLNECVFSLMELSLLRRLRSDLCSLDFFWFIFLTAPSFTCFLSTALNEDGILQGCQGKWVGIVSGGRSRWAG